MIRRLSVRACRDEACWDREGYHSHHLTLLGHWRYIGRWSARRWLYVLLVGWLAAAGLGEHDED